MRFSRLWRRRGICATAVEVTIEAGGGNEWPGGPVLMKEGRRAKPAAAGSPPLQLHILSLQSPIQRPLCVGHHSRSRHYEPPSLLTSRSRCSLSADPATCTTDGGNTEFEIVPQLVMKYKAPIRGGLLSQCTRVYCDCFDFLMGGRLSLQYHLLQCWAASASLAPSHSSICACIKDTID